MGEVLDPENEPIEQFHRELQGAARGLRLDLAKISYYGWKMRLSEGWTRFGFQPGSKGEEAYSESLGIPRSTYFKRVRIGQALHQLSLADLERIPVTNAELLMQVNPAVVHDHQWIAEAKTLKPKAFAELITSRNKAVGDEREPLTNLFLRVPFLAKKAIEDMLETFQKKHELSSKGQALELMIADLQHDNNLLSAVNQARELLRGVAQSMKNRRAPEDEQLWVRLAQELLDEGYQKTVQTARSKPDSGEEDGGRA